MGLPDRTSKAALQGIQVILARIRNIHIVKVNGTVSVRFHSDVEKSFEGAVLNYIQERRKGPGSKQLQRDMIVMPTL